MDQLKQLFQNTLLVAYPLFQNLNNNERIFHKWKGLCTLINSDVTYIDDPIYTSTSFKKLANWISYKESQGVGIMKIAAQIEVYRPEVFELLANDIEKEFEIPLVKQKQEKKHIEEQQSFIEHSSAGFMYHLTDTIAKNNFTEDKELNAHIAELPDKSNSLVVVSSRFNDGDMKLRGAGELNRWNTLVDSTFVDRVMDDLTADCLDIVTEIWVKSASTESSPVHIGYEEILEICGMKQVRNGKSYYRKEDRLKIMERLAALASIFIYVNEDNEIVILNDDENPNESLAYKKQRVRRLFVMDEIVFAKDINTDEMLGIESMNVAPGTFLSKYLYGSEKLTGLLSKKALEYNSKQQRYHKRLTRYLSWRWRIQQAYKHLVHPYSIGGPKGLLSVMGVSMNQNPARIRNVFEKTLDDLMRDEVIKEWQYQTPIDEMKCSGRNWLENYWLNLKVTVTPTDELVSLQQELLQKKKIIPKNKLMGTLVKESVIEVQDMGKEDVQPLQLNQQQKNKDINWFQQKILQYKEENKCSLRDMAKEIEVSPSNLSKLLTGKRKRLSEETRNKLDKWIERQEVVNLL
ncbi:helix-turn-helix transcriptional regulator [Bacillus cereus]|uniref:helix-turn-helix domain-containing protein n=1 Tax=Bacillus cereus TaxID=1396 RepID=UPI0024067BD3|nr:helix-turn-helix transcriptional regulator [Bacillus cereus]MDF9504277.1 helix-turn-helix transcriptional regulator [Bacillus cereus]MDF9597205.1 helix-turn-helix transcriptional regulator [Bacillus cereus]MDF9609031.1 helix-turn-helix transcriptional regulator [Bacillus cereus]MDF9660245.1 helix-turn-helix transcriptional regulator [Bacillus cereus]